ncbi:hypothetical protein FCM35_KLT17062 [Carex littledalei]|uniref:Uncharacterized protein n=1 Tax=Carex littledalei TaxID=544730 RepID=A0A833QYB1_9POAL|nr:hypothetical protein FCM35_KLT17062 [Carex littledalei]
MWRRICCKKKQRERRSTRNCIKTKKKKEKEEEEEEMDRSITSFLIGCIGAAVTLLSYSQTIVSSTQCITIGLLILMFALFIKEGFISI